MLKIILLLADSDSSVCKVILKPLPILSYSDLINIYIFIFLKRALLDSSISRTECRLSSCIAALYIDIFLNLFLLLLLLVDNFISHRRLFWPACRSCLCRLCCLWRLCCHSAWHYNWMSQVFCQTLLKPLPGFSFIALWDRFPMIPRALQQMIAPFKALKVLHGPWFVRGKRVARLCPGLGRVWHSNPRCFTAWPA